MASELSSVLKILDLEPLETNLFRGVSLDPGMPETNIVFFDTTAAGIAPVDFVARLLEHGIRMGHISRRVRAVTHLDVSRAEGERAVDVVRKLLSA